MLTVGTYTIGAPGEAGADIRLHPRPSRFAPDGSMRPTVPYGYGDAPDTAKFLSRVAAMDLRGLRVADVGAGTGVLALAAARGGASVVAFESDPVSRELLAANVALNGAAVEVRGAFPDEWDGRPFDVVLANMGAAVPPRGAGGVVLVTGDRNLGVARLDEVDADRRPAMRTRAEEAALVRAARRSYAPTLQAAHAALLGKPSKWAEAEHVEDWKRVANRIRQRGQEVLEQHPGDEAAVAMLVERGNEGKLAKHAYLRDVGAATGTPWADITVNLVTLSCGCEHEQWFTDGHADGTADLPKTVRHHQARRQCAHHPGDARAAWQLAHEQFDLAGDAQRMAPDATWRLVSGRLVLDVPPADRGRVGAALRLVHGAPGWMELR